MPTVSSNFVGTALAILIVQRSTAVLSWLKKNEPKTEHIFKDEHISSIVTQFIYLLIYFVSGSLQQGVGLALYLGTYRFPREYVTK